MILRPIPEVLRKTDTSKRGIWPTAITMLQANTLCSIHYITHEKIPEIRRRIKVCHLRHFSHCGTMYDSEHTCAWHSRVKIRENQESRRLPSHRNARYAKEQDRLITSRALCVAAREAFQSARAIKVFSRRYAAPNSCGPKGVQ